MIKPYPNIKRFLWFPRFLRFTIKVAKWHISNHLLPSKEIIYFLGTDFFFSILDSSIKKKQETCLFYFVSKCHVIDYLLAYLSYCLRCKSLFIMWKYLWALAWLDRNGVTIRLENTIYWNHWNNQNCIYKYNWKWYWSNYSMTI